MALALSCLLAGWSVAGAGDGTLSVEFDAARDALQVRAHDVELVEVLESIAQKTGMKLVAHGASHGKVSAELPYMPLERALKQLLDGRSFALARGTQPGQPLTVWLLSSRSARASTVVSRPAAPGPDPVDAAREAVAELAANLSPEQAEALERAFGDASEIGNLLESLQGQLPDDEVMQQLHEALTRDAAALPPAIVPGTQ